MTRTYQHQIAGDWFDSGSADIERRSPAHGGSLAAFAAGTAATVDAAVRAAPSREQPGAICLRLDGPPCLTAGPT